MFSKGKKILPLERLVPSWVQLSLLLFHIRSALAASKDIVFPDLRLLSIPFNYRLHMLKARQGLLDGVTIIDSWHKCQ